jgi:uncharacterized protein (UPF0333 family)
MLEILEYILSVLLLMVLLIAGSVATHFIRKRRKKK